MYPVGASQHGVLDMLGNVWEWCLNTYDDKLDTTITAGGQRALRGGSWSNDQASLLDWGQNEFDADFRFGDIGFRLVQDSEF
jgi:formylglycine-generating enzyme required for sulfatase activity